MTTKGKIITWSCAVVAVALAIFIYFKFYFVFGEGVKAGELNQIVHKGWVWKTYEGRLIQTGFSSAKKGGNIQSNEFNNGYLPWRGMQKYIVDGIVSVREATVSSEVPIFTSE